MGGVWGCTPSPLCRATGRILYNIRNGFLISCVNFQPTFPKSHFVTLGNKRWLSLLTEKGVNKAGVSLGRGRFLCRFHILREHMSALFNLIFFGTKASGIKIHRAPCEVASSYSQSCKAREKQTWDLHINATMYNIVWVPEVSTLRCPQSSTDT